MTRLPKDIAKFMSSCLGINLHVLVRFQRVKFPDFFNTTVFLLYKSIFLYQRQYEVGQKRTWFQNFRTVKQPQQILESP